MGNRPINRRPWRRKPWRKSRPTRWNASTNQANDGVILNTSLFITTPDGNAPIAALVDGQVDVEPWADDQEVTVDRIVGSIHLHGYFQSYFPSGTNTLANKVPLIKLGIVLVEEISKDPASAAPTRNLFDQEDLEDTEWMWLWSGFPEPWSVRTAAFTTSGAPTANVFSTFAMSIPIDIRNRRKIGQSDVLALYGEYAAPGPEYDISVLSYTDVRTILMSR